MKVLEMNSSSLNSTDLRCDGCGQLASPEHIARRLQRLEWTTRFRPIHISTLFLGAIASALEPEFLYAAKPGFAGEAAAVLEAAGLKGDEKSSEAKLLEFQRGGFFLAHVLECPLESSADDAARVSQLLEDRLPFALARIRRSLRPKRVVPISGLLDPLLNRLQSIDLGYPLLLNRGSSFALDGKSDVAIAQLQGALSAAATSAR